MKIADWPRADKSRGLFFCRFDEIKLAFQTISQTVRRRDGNLLKIQNIGEAPVQINGVVVNDRADCATLNVLPQGNMLKVGDAMTLMPLCEAVRVKVTTATGSETYYLAR